MSNTTLIVDTSQHPDAIRRSPKYNRISSRSRIVTDSMTGNDGDVLGAGHVGELGAVWTQHPSYAWSLQLDDANRCYKQNGAATYSMVYASGVPATADYETGARFRWLSYGGADGQRDGGVAARVNVAADTFYLAWLQSVVQPGLHLYRVNAGVATELGAPGISFVPVVGTDYDVYLRAIGSTITVGVRAAGAGWEQLSRVDAAPIAAAGRAGLRAYNDLVANNVLGLHVDNYYAVGLP